jgi:hypothetical protein
MKAEGGVLGGARGKPRVRAELVHPVTGNRHLEGVVSLLTDAPEGTARRELARRWPNQ